MDPDVGVVLVAAGAGTRFGGPKAFVELEGRSLLERSAEPFEGFPDRVVVVRDEDRPLIRLPGWRVVAGGARRRDSVKAGLEALAPTTRFVLIHDAARPLASRDLVARVAAAARSGVAVVPALPVTDTIKRVVGARVLSTPDRAELVRVQTPQGFSVALLARALAASDRDASDEAGLVEGLGEEVRILSGEPRNIKVTTPLDLEIARALLRTPLADSSVIMGGPGETAG